MSEYNYLVAISLIEKKGKLAMPLGGKSIKTNQLDEDLAKNISLELLLRLFEQSDKDSIARINTNECFLVANIPMTKMNEQLPLLKSNWLASGITSNFINELKILSNGLWKLNYKKYKGIIFTKL